MGGIYMKTQTVLNYTIKDVERLSEKELRVAVSTLRSTARKRYERLLNADIYSPAMRGIMSKSPSTDAVFPTVRGMDTTTLRNELKRYKMFINAPTSTKAGAISYQQKQHDIITDVVGEDLTEEETTEFWEIYEDMKNTGVGGVLDYKKVMEIVGDVYEERRKPSSKLKRTKRAVKQEVKKRLDKIYEDEQLPAKIYTSKHFNNYPD